MKKLALVFALAAACNAHAATNLLVNGSFEDSLQNNGSWNVYQTLPGWTGAPNIELRNNVAGKAYDGNNFVELDTHYNSSMFQDVQTRNGQKYQLSFFWSARPNTGDTNDIDVFWNGQRLTHLAGSNNTANHQWQEFKFTVTGGANPLSRLSFSAVGRNDSYGGSLDKVNLFTASAAPVPEASTYAMLLGGIALLGLFGRRRNKQCA